MEITSQVLAKLLFLQAFFLFSSLPFLIPTDKLDKRE